MRQSAGKTTIRTGVPLAAACTVAMVLAPAVLADLPDQDADGTGLAPATRGGPSYSTSAAVAPPAVLQAPEVAGSLRDGGLAYALPGVWKGDLPMRFGNRWERCDAQHCSSTGRTGFAMRLVAADVGKRLRAVVTARNGARSVSALSRQSALVRPKLRPIDPFPIVALKGYVARRGTFITRLAASAPPGALLQVTCRGRGCPFRRTTSRFENGPIAVRRMHRRTLGIGAVFALRITQGPDRVGKYTRFRVRPRRKPVRVDRCLSPDERPPLPCERAGTSGPRARGSS